MNQQVDTVDSSTPLSDFIKRPAVLWMALAAALLVVLIIVILATDVGFATVKTSGDKQKVDRMQKFVAAIWDNTRFCQLDALWDSDKVQDSGVTCSAAIWNNDAICNVDGLWNPESDVWSCEKIVETPKIIPTILDNAVNLRTLLDALHQDREAASDQYGYREFQFGSAQAGPPKPYHFMVEGEGLVLAINVGLDGQQTVEELDDEAAQPEEDVKLRNVTIDIDVEPHDGVADASIQIGSVIIGRSVRDAVGFLGFENFLIQQDHGGVDTAIKDIIREEVTNKFVNDFAASVLGAPPTTEVDLIAALQELQGKGVSFYGTFSLQYDDGLDSVLITPVRIETMDLERYDFVAPEYVDTIWNKPQVVPTVLQNAKDLPTVLTALDENADNAAGSFRLYGKPGPNNTYSFMVQGSGQVVGIHSGITRNTVDIALDGYDGTVQLQVGPEISGTAVRDSVGFLSYDVFNHDRKFREVNEEINRRIETTILNTVYPPLLYGQQVTFYGAFTLKGPDDFTAEALDDVLVTPVQLQVQSSGVPFNASAYVDAIWDTEIVPTVTDDSVAIETLLDALAADPAAALEQYGRVGEGGVANYLVAGTGAVVAVDTSSRNGFVMLDIIPEGGEADGEPDVMMLIGAVFRSNAIRDAVGFIPPLLSADQNNLIAYSNISKELNFKVRDEVIVETDQDALQAMFEGQTVSFAGALALDDSGQPVVVPVQLSFAGES